ncbi:hypothetical protein N0V83_008482 [Neocucurbitaria cava]|uniref:Uncharacterized protein n=1 Tax=Neocucurbitaria cava TaxID=798079 RepID=A0A9W8Y381_9PLEO|nr:hypothetical protein N0V83_008482 [Neocucurbitaria cava]
MASPKPSKEYKVGTPSKPSPAAKATGWLKKVTSRREVFRPDFSFDVPSSRRSCDRTPQISPRTSVSMPFLTIEKETVKRKRIDSSDTEMALDFACPSGNACPCSKYLQTTPQTPPRGDPAPRLARCRANTSPPRPKIITEDAHAAHPGRLIDFASPSPSSEYKLRIGTRAYHEYLSTSLRRKSFPNNDGGAAKRHGKEMKMLAKLDRELDTTAAKEFVESKAKAEATKDSSKQRLLAGGWDPGPYFWDLINRAENAVVSGSAAAEKEVAATRVMFGGGSSDSDGDDNDDDDNDDDDNDDDDEFIKQQQAREAPCTLERRDRTQRTSSPRSSPSTSSSKSSAPSTTTDTMLDSSNQGFAGLKRSTSDRSTEAFLAHVRKSAEARKEAEKRWRRYPVFADEVEKGFLSDEPL